MPRKRAKRQVRKPVRRAQGKRHDLVVFYKVSIFTTLVIILGAFLFKLFSPLVSGSANVLGAFIAR